MYGVPTAQQEMERKHRLHMLMRKQDEWLKDLFARANLVTGTKPKSKPKGKKGKK